VDPKAAEPEIVGAAELAGFDVWVELVQTLWEPVRLVAVTLAKTKRPASDLVIV
jgi:hypothetical protein